MTKNFYLDENQGVDFFPQKTAEKVAANIAAIKLVKELEEEGKQASPAQQESLAKYVGWGGLANYFFDERNPRFAAERAQLKELVSSDEYSSMKQSSLTAYYTDPDIARAMWAQAVDGDMDRGNILDPSMGTGIFFMTLPKELRTQVGNGIELYGVELDKITGSIAKQLFPEANIYIKGFQDVHFIGNNFDLVISNIPFGNLRIMNDEGNKAYMIHDYFLKKSIDLVRNYGQVAIISSTGLMDKPTSNVLPEVLVTSRFLGGVRLPQNAFKRLAGTDVTTDILFFQKDVDHTEPGLEGSYDYLISTEKEYTNAAGTRVDKVYVNKFFQSSQNILGEVQISHFNGATFTVKKNDYYLEELADRLFAYTLGVSAKFNENLATTKVFVQSPEEHETFPKYEFTLDSNDNIVYRQDKETFVNAKPASVSFLRNVTTGEEKPKFKSKTEEELFNQVGAYSKMFLSKQSDTSEWRKGVYYYKKPLSDKEIKRIKGMTAIKASYRKLIHDETNMADSEAVQADLKALNNIYDEFVDEFGVINDKTNMSAFSLDNYYPLIASLEEQKNNEDGSVSFVKGTVFTKPMILGQVQAQEVKSAKEALLSSTVAGHGVDLAYMASVYPNHTEEQILFELQEDDTVLPDVMDYTDSGEADGKLTFLSKNDALSGDLIGKIEAVERLIAINDTAYDWKHYLELLEDSKPTPLTITDISFRLGSSWIPNTVVATFLMDTFGSYSKMNDFVRIPSIDELVYNVGNERYINDTFMSQNEFGGENRKYAVRRDGSILRNYNGAIKIISHMLLGKTPNITMSITENGKTRVVKDVVSTQLLRENEYKLDKLFKNFVKSSEELTTVLEDAYNHKFNRIVDKTYDGSELEVEGLSDEFKLRDYQKNAVMRIVTEKRALLAHEVGMGKTLTMISAGFKLKELGLANRPTFVVPSSLTAQFGKDIYKFYPNKHVLVAGKDDFTEVNRKSFMARIIANDYDAVVMSYEQFKVLKVSDETMKSFLEKQIAQLEDNIERFNEMGGGDQITVKNMEQRKSSLVERVEKLSSSVKKDEFLTFEELGIDFLFVDEAHHFKNLQPVSLLGAIKGISTSNSQMANDMKMKIDYLHSVYGGSNVVFATGTPVSNSISEVWTMMDYIQPDVLEKYGIDSFDSFAGSFGLIESKLELDTTGTKYKESRRFSKFVNLPELLHIFKVSTDIKLGKSLDIKIPKAKTIVVPSNLTPAQHAVINDLVERTERMQNERIDPSMDNMLKVVHDARCLTLDMRLLGDYDRSDSSKLSQAAENIYRIWKRTKNVKGTQFVFSNMGTPGNKMFDAYNELKQILVDKGIPESEIAFVHSANTKEKKNILQKKANDGEIRVLVGSTEKGGTGYNVQTRMKAIHHLDVPWRPSDLIQRNGRAIRNGNVFKEVEIYQYITKGSFDNYLWQIQENKLKYIGQVMTDEEPSRAINAADDVNDSEMSASEFKAIATENPYLKEKMEVDNRLTSLTNQRSAKERNLRQRQREYQNAVDNLPKEQAQLEGMKADVAFLRENGAGTQFIFADGQVFEKAKDDANHLLAYCWKAINGQLSPDEAVATIGGFDILIEDRGLASSFNKNRYVKISLRKNATYSIGDVDITKWTGIGVLIRIKNTINGLAAEMMKLENKISSLTKIANAGVNTDDDVETMNAEIEYLSEKQGLLNKYLLDEDMQNNVEEIAEAVRNFENNWRANHPEFAAVSKMASDEKEAAKSADIEQKLIKAIESYDDSLFRAITDEPQVENASEAEEASEKKQHTVKKPEIKKTISTVKRETLPVNTTHITEIHFNDDGSMDLVSLLEEEKPDQPAEKTKEKAQAKIKKVKAKSHKEEIPSEKVEASFDDNGCMNLLDLLA